MRKLTLDKVYLKTIDLLNKEKVTYLIIGGLATGVIGEARLTQDIDVLITIAKHKIKSFLNRAKKEPSRPASRMRWASPAERVPDGRSRWR